MKFATPTFYTLTQLGAAAYTHVEVNPVSYDKATQSLNFCNNDDPDIVCWSVYLRVEGQGVDCVADFETQEQAQHFATWLANFAGLKEEGEV